MRGRPKDLSAVLDIRSVCVGNAESNRLTALKTLSMNLRGAKADLEAAGEDTEGMANSTAELRDELLKLTGVDIMLNEDERKLVLFKPAQIGEHPEVGNSEGKICVEINSVMFRQNFHCNTSKLI